MKTTEQENNRNLDGTFKQGFSGNPGGRPKGLKNYDQQRFANMTDEEKEEFLSKISPELRYRMAEGNPHQTQDLTSGGEKLNQFNLFIIELVKFFSPTC